MRITYIMLAAFLTLASCAKEEMPQAQDTADTAAEKADVINGWVRIKLARDSEPLSVGVFTRGVSESGNTELDALAAKLGATEIHRVFSDGGRFVERRRKAGLHLWYDIRIDDNIAVSRALSEAGAIPIIEHSQPLYKLRMADTFTAVPEEYVFVPSAVRPALTAREMPVNDPKFNKQWHYYNDGSVPGAVAGADINLLEGWEKFTAGNRAVIVADIDDGFDISHEDLADNIWVNEGEIPDNGIDDDNNGYTDDIYGYDFVNDTGKLTLGSGHGTHTGGTIAAVNNNGKGVCGVAGGTGNGDGVRLMCLQFNPGNATARYLDAFAYAADNGAVLTSNSWSLVMDAMPKDVGEAIDYFNEYAGTDLNGNQTGPMKGGLCMFAAGNNNESGPQYIGKAFYPAADPRVIGVAAMMIDYKKAPYSQYGQGVDVIAPGGDNVAEEGQRIYSTLPGGYGYMSGTSMATPHVTGVAALIVSQYGTKGAGFTSSDLRRRLTGCCRDIGAYQGDAWRNGIGAGLLDVAAIDVDERNPSGKPQWSGEPSVTGLNDGLKISCKVPADGTGKPVTWLFVNVAAKDSSEKPSSLRYGFNSKVDDIFNLELKAIGDKSYVVEIYMQDRYGNVSDKYVKEVKTLAHINRPPKLRTALGDVIISQVDASFVRTLDVSSYFADRDIPEFGDALTFSVSENSENEIADIAIENTSFVKVTPKASGFTKAIIRATDKAGEFVEGTFIVSVLFKPFSDIEIAGVGKDNIVRLDLSGNLYSPEGNKYTIQATSSDVKIARVTFDRANNLLVITPLAKGEAKIALNVNGSLQGVNSFDSSFTVKVSEGGGSGGSGSVPDGSISVYPNPAPDNINLALGGASTGTEIEIKIYDSALRLLKKDAGVLDQQGVAVFDVSKLSPGAYTIVALSEGKSYTVNFLKK